MFTRLRSRSSFADLLILTLLVGLVIFVVVERWDSERLDERLALVSDQQDWGGS